MDISPHRPSSSTSGAASPKHRQLRNEPLGGDDQRAGHTAGRHIGGEDAGVAVYLDQLRPGQRTPP
jgi:hypothetical protein